MSLLFCSWATDGVEENDEEHSEKEEEQIKNDIGSSDNLKISEDSKQVKKAEINEHIINVNGKLVSNSKEDANPSMFILWKDSNLDYESEDEDEKAELENTTAAPTKEEEKEAPVTTNGIKENGDENKEEDSLPKKEDNPPVKEPIANT